MKALYENNFWDLYPDLKIIKELNVFYTKDTSKKKETSSRTMWAIDFAYNPESRFYNIPKKLQVIASDFLKNDKFKYQKMINF